MERDARDYRTESGAVDHALEHAVSLSITKRRSLSHCLQMQTWTRPLLIILRPDFWSNAPINLPKIYQEIKTLDPDYHPMQQIRVRNNGAMVSIYLSFTLSYFAERYRKIAQIFTPGWRDQTLLVSWVW